MTTTNDITGDTLSNIKGNAEAYARGWDAIFGNKEDKQTLLDRLRSRAYYEDNVELVELLEAAADNIEYLQGRITTLIEREW